MGTCQSKCVLQQFFSSFFSLIRFLSFVAHLVTRIAGVAVTRFYFPFSTSKIYEQSIFWVHYHQQQQQSISIFFLFVVYFWGLMWLTATKIQQLLLYGNPWQLPRSLLWSMGFRQVAEERGKLGYKFWRELVRIDFNRAIGIVFYFVYIKKLKSKKIKNL